VQCLHEDEAREAGSALGNPLVPGFDDHAVGEVRAVRARRPAGGAVPLHRRH